MILGKYTLPDEPEALLELANSKIDRLPSYPEPSLDMTEKAFVTAFLDKFPLAFDHKRTTVRSFYSALWKRVAEAIVDDPEGYLLSDNLGILMISRYTPKAPRKSRLTGKTLTNVHMNGDSICTKWIRDQKDANGLKYYAFKRNRELMRSAGKQCLKGKQYQVVRGETDLANMLSQVGVMKQRYDAQINKYK